MRKLQGLYVITDASLISEKNFAYSIQQALEGGARIIQYRDKSTNNKKRYQQAQLIKNLCEDYQATCIINDDIQLAIDVDAHGIHIGNNDASIEYARTKLGKDKIIGVSCYNNFEYATRAEENKANYIAFGSAYPSSIKPQAKRASIDLFLKAKQELHIPICAIGGITLDNAKPLVASGVDMLAVITGVFSSKDIKQVCTDFSLFFK